MGFARSTFLAALPLLVVLTGGGCTPDDPSTTPRTDAPTDDGKAKAKAKAKTKVAGPGPAPVDPFHPDVQAGKPQPKPAYGGRVIVHMSSMPESLAYPIENSGVTRRILYEVTETLIRQDWETWEYEPSVSTGWETEDQLILKPGAAAKYGDAVRVINYDRVEDPEPGAPEDAKPKMVEGKRHFVYGKAVLEGEEWVVTPASKGGKIAEGSEVRVAAADVESAELGTVFTFKIRDDVTWHPANGISGHKLDAHDVLFSWQLYGNPAVDCDEKRFSFQKILDAEVVDDHTIRFFYLQQYAFALKVPGEMTLVPSHIYNLKDKDNKDFNAKATDEQQAKHINENPHNLKWVGVGPYRVTEFNQQFIEAERFADYFDKDNAGYVDTIRWRVISDDNAAFQAFLAGEVDYFDRVKSADYFGEATEKPSFTDIGYKGYYYLGTYGYTGWNMLQPQLKDRKVRQALAHAFDFDEYLRTNYKGLANQVTGPMPFFSMAYNHDVKPYPYDMKKAEELLTEAGWYDRNGNGTIDKDGLELEIEFLFPSGNEASKTWGLKLQEQYEKLGVKLKLREKEWAAFLDDILNRKFDACNLAWIPPLESDPEQLWHSKWGQPEVRSSNHSAVMNPKIDAIIERGQKELDTEKRQAIWRELHAEIYDMQPYLFGYQVPKKFAANKNIRGLQNLKIDPGYVIRRWYYPEGTPDTRAQP